MSWNWVYSPWRFLHQIPRVLLVSNRHLLVKCFLWNCIGLLTSWCLYAKRKTRVVLRVGILFYRRSFYDNDYRLLIWNLLPCNELILPKSLFVLFWRYGEIVLQVIWLTLVVVLMVLQLQSSLLLYLYWTDHLLLPHQLPPKLPELHVFELYYCRRPDILYVHVHRNFHSVYLLRRLTEYSWLFGYSKRINYEWNWQFCSSSLLHYPNINNLFCVLILLFASYFNFEKEWKITRKWETWKLQF